MAGLARTQRRVVPGCAHGKEHDGIVAEPHRGGRGFNIITSLGLMVMEKQGEVAILQTQGLTPRQIMMVFMVQGASAGIIGALLGAALGALLASQLNNLMPIIGAFLDGAALPVAIEPLQVIVIALVAMAIALLSTLYPSWRAAATQPAEALRYE